MKEGGAMTGKERIVMSKREARRLHVVRQIIEKKLTQENGAFVLGVTDRQIRRIIRRVRKERLKPERKEKRPIRPAADHPWQRYPSKPIGKEARLLIHQNPKWRLEKPDISISGLHAVTRLRALLCVSI
jgi:hypothetical protein